MNEQVPKATYRIQFGPDFDFKAACEIVPYLSKLGISHLYASPIFAARTGSRHGYDITDPCSVNPELGGYDAFEELTRKLKKHRLGYIQDIVPNHMAFDSENWMLMDVLENGEASRYFGFFDIMREDTSQRKEFKIAVPFLSKPYGECLAGGDIALVYDQAGLGIEYSDLRLPVRLESYAAVLRHGMKTFEHTSAEKDCLEALRAVIATLESLASIKDIGRRSSGIAHAKTDLWKLYSSSQPTKDYVDEVIDTFNRSGPSGSGPQLLNGLISQQLFRLIHWRDAATEMNYRRFFTVNRLICVRMEEFSAFFCLHLGLRNLVDMGHISGLRIDHIDGLFDPLQYLKRLRHLMHLIHGTYIVVEKILGTDEDLPPSWPVQGTTGYDFLNHANGLFCDRAKAGEFDRIYEGFTGGVAPYADIRYESKRLITEKYMPREMRYLARLAKKLVDPKGRKPGLTLEDLQAALVELVACFPAYRTYGEPEGFSQQDKKQVEEAFSSARSRSPDLSGMLDILYDIFSGQAEAALSKDKENQALYFIRRFQQFTGPAMAKGFEDTALYLYNRLISLNEVGGDPSRFGIEAPDFHAFIERRQAQWPNSVNATSTHDTKRGEDTRARIDVLSEIPGEWNEQVTTWRDLNKVARERHGVSAVSPSLEYFLYQTLVGAFPFEQSEYSDFAGRIKTYMIKAAREAKTRTAWYESNAVYEERLVAFLDEILKPAPENRFLEDFLPFQRKIAYYGILNSLSQTLIKIAAPGVPDFYQGSELWNLSLVDPDNRRPVDFKVRRKHLHNIEVRCRRDVLSLLKDLLLSMEDGRVKLFLIYRALQTRKLRIDLFRKGRYIPLDTRGSLCRHVIAFGRCLGDESAIAVVPRLPTAMVKPGELPLGDGVWGDTEIALPRAFPSRWKDAITDKVLISERTLRLADILEHFPAALLMNDRGQL